MSGQLFSNRQKYALRREIFRGIDRAHKNVKRVEEFWLWRRRGGEMSVSKGVTQKDVAELVVGARDRLVQNSSQDLAAHNG